MLSYMSGTGHIISHLYFTMERIKEGITAPSSIVLFYIYICIYKNIYIIYKYIYNYIYINLYKFIYI